MAGSGRCVMVTTTVGNARAARRMAEAMVSARLAACVQCVPIHSTYRWQGAVEQAREILLIAKTRAALARRLAAFLRAAHNYELPEVAVVPIVGGLAPYLNWIASETTVDASRRSGHYRGRKTRSRK